MSIPGTSTLVYGNLTPLRRIRGMPTKLSDAELLRYRSTIYGVAAHVGHVPKMSLGELPT